MVFSITLTPCFNLFRCFSYKLFLLSNSYLKQMSPSLLGCFSYKSLLLELDVEADEPHSPQEFQLQVVAADELNVEADKPLSSSVSAASRCC